MQQRLWRVFTLSRMFSALMLFLLLSTQAGVMRLTQDNPWAWLLSNGYLLFSLLAWGLLRHSAPVLRWDWRHTSVLALELAIVCALQILYGREAGDFTFLLILPLLAASCMASVRVALGLAAAVTIALMGAQAAQWHLAWFTHSVPLGFAPLGPMLEHSMHMALLCALYMGMTYFAHVLVRRLAQQQQLARHSQRWAQAQSQASALIIDKLSEGVLVLSSTGHVHLANPAALRLLGCEPHPQPPNANALCLADAPRWRPLLALLQQCQHSACPQQQVLELEHDSAASASTTSTQLLVRVWMAAAADDALAAEQASAWPQTPDTSFTQKSLGYAPTPPLALFVMFLGDLQEVQQRLHTEKMAAMGRMSAAVAHEIRNPLAAIIQANALLAEELHGPAQQRLSHMIRQNAQRLSRTVQDVLDIARVRDEPAGSATLALNATAAAIWHEWLASRTPGTDSARFELRIAGDEVNVAFDSDHLRRVATNLLDNAERHARSHAAQSSSCDPSATSHAPWVQLSTGISDAGEPWLQVWSAGAALHPGVRRHLFEPFFSSQSRSTGLGLFICRELCERHGAAIAYERRNPEGHSRSDAHDAGNAFIVYLRRSDSPKPT